MIKCSRCQHEWEYKGNSKWYICCPMCRKNINLELIERKKRIELKAFKEQLAEIKIEEQKIEEIFNEVKNE